MELFSVLFFLAAVTLLILLVQTRNKLRSIMDRLFRAQRISREEYRQYTGKLPPGGLPIPGAPPVVPGAPGGQPFIPPAGNVPRGQAPAGWQVMPQHPVPGVPSSIDTPSASVPAAQAMQPAATNQNVFYGAPAISPTTAPVASSQVAAPAAPGSSGQAWPVQTPTAAVPVYQTTTPTTTQLWGMQPPQAVMPVSVSSANGWQPPTVAAPPFPGANQGQAPATPVAAVPFAGAPQQPAAAAPPPFTPASPVYPQPSMLPSTPAKAAKAHNRGAINVVLGLGVAFILLAGLVFATTTWQHLPSPVRLVLLVGMCVVFFAASLLAEKRFQLSSTGKAFYVLGSLFTMFSLIAAAYFRLLGPWFAIGAQGEGAVFATGAMLVALCGAWGLRRYKQAVFFWQAALFGEAAVFILLRQYIRPSHLASPWAHCGMAILSCLLLLGLHIFPLWRPAAQVLAKHCRRFALLNFYVLGFCGVVFLAGSGHYADITAAICVTAALLLLLYRKGLPAARWMTPVSLYFLFYNLAQLLPRYSEERHLLFSLLCAAAFWVLRALHLPGGQRVAGKVANLLFPLWLGITTTLLCLGNRTPVSGLVSLCLLTAILVHIAVQATWRSTAAPAAALLVPLPFVLYAHLHSLAFGRLDGISNEGLVGGGAALWVVTLCVTFLAALAALLWSGRMAAALPAGHPRLAAARRLELATAISLLLASLIAAFSNLSDSYWVAGSTLLPSLLLRLATVLLPAIYLFIQLQATQAGLPCRLAQMGRGAPLAIGLSLLATLSVGNLVAFLHLPQLATRISQNLFDEQVTGLCWLAASVFATVMLWCTALTRRKQGLSLWGGAPGKSGTAIPSPANPAGPAAGHTPPGWPTAPSSVPLAAADLSAPVAFSANTAQPSAHATALNPHLHTAPGVTVSLTAPPSLRSKAFAWCWAGLAMLLPLCTLVCWAEAYWMDGSLHRNLYAAITLAVSFLAVAGTFLGKQSILAMLPVLAFYPVLSNIVFGSVPVAQSWWLALVCFVLYALLSRLLYRKTWQLQNGQPRVDWFALCGWLMPASWLLSGDASFWFYGLLLLAAWFALFAGRLALPHAGCWAATAATACLFLALGTQPFYVFPTILQTEVGILLWAGWLLTLRFLVWRQAVAAAPATRQGPVINWVVLMGIVLAIFRQNIDVMWEQQALDSLLLGGMVLMPLAVYLTVRWLHHPLPPLFSRAFGAVSVALSQGGLLIPAALFWAGAIAENWLGWAVLALFACTFLALRAERLDIFSLLPFTLYPFAFCFVSRAPAAAPQQLDCWVSGGVFVLAALVGLLLYRPAWQKHGRWPQLDLFSLCNLVAPLYWLLSGNAYFQFYGALLLGLWFCLFWRRLPWQSANRWLGTGLAASLMLACWLQPFVIWPALLATELKLLPLLGFALTLRWLIWRSKPQPMGWLLFGVTVCCMLWQGADALRLGFAADGIILGLAGLAVLVFACIARRRRWFLLGVITLLAMLLYNTAAFWASLAWWIYLLAVGILLIVIAAANEAYRQKGSNLGRRLLSLGFFTQWEW